MPVVCIGRRHVIALLVVVHDSQGFISSCLLVIWISIAVCLSDNEDAGWILWFRR